MRNKSALHCEIDIAKWRKAIHRCLQSKGCVLLDSEKRCGTILCCIVPGILYHPLQSLLYRRESTSEVSQCICIYRLHPVVNDLLKNVSHSLSEEDQSVLLRAFLYTPDTHGMSWMESTQCASVLNLHDDVILPYCRDAENARTVLININEALAIIESRHFGGGRIRILISHQNGYFGRDFDFFNAKITRFIRLEKEEDVALTENLVKKFDSFCEKYQTECQVATQVRRPSTTLGLDLNVHVNAQYNVWMDPSRLEQESEFGTDWMQGHMFKLNFVWNGLENTRAFLCPPIESSEAHTSFSVQLRQATSDDPHPNVASTSSPEYQPCHWERDLYLLRALGKVCSHKRICRCVPEAFFACRHWQIRNIVPKSMTMVCVVKKGESAL